MDIWKWVNQTQSRLRDSQPRLVEVIAAVPDAVCDSRFEQADALVAEGLTLAKAAKEPWLEVFFRHWRAQSHVCFREEGQAMLDEVVSLYELAHREENEKCPQSVCVTQDLALVYGNVDGEGYAEERLAVAEETLAKIDPSWGCFTCISAEKSSALRDMGKDSEALAYRRQQESLAQAARHRIDSPSWRTGTLHLLCSLQRWDEAQTLLKKQKQKDVEPTYQQQAQLYQAWIRHGQGNDAAALKAMPAWDDVVRLKNHWLWLEVSRQLPIAQPTVWCEQAWQTVQLMHRGGAHRKTLIAIEYWFEHALPLYAVQRAEHALRLAAEHLPLLNRPLDAPARLAVLQAQLEAVALPACPYGLEDLIAQAQAALAGEDTPHPPSLYLVWLLPNSALVETLDPQLERTLQLQVGDPIAFQKKQEHRLLQDPANPALANALLDTLLENQDHATLRELAEVIRPYDPTTFHFWWVCLAEQQQDWLNLIEHADLLLALMPEAYNTQRRRCQALQALGRYEEASASYQALFAALDQARIDTPPPLRWNALINASASNQWSVVRQLAAKLGMTLDPSNDPSDDENAEVCEHWGDILLRMDDGEDHRARRTGPCTAELLRLAPPNASQCYLASWVFDATPLTNLTDPAEGEMRTYRAVHCRKPSAYQPTVFFCEPKTSPIDTLKAQLPDAAVWVDYGEDDEEYHDYWFTAPIGEPLAEVIEAFCQQHLATP
jgi:hypothetical protein